ncbi:SDR family NAD(P)-dependent oxidoreductase [Pediococcus parvulus]|uniref:SDR family oxidoreductase n=1 Tax=Pediococcus parvulus TaxID=54062 RepID=UPI00345F0C22
MTNKTWLITGTSSGFGKALATLLAKKGTVNLVATARNIEKLHYLDEFNHGQIQKLTLDVTNQHEIQAVVEKTNTIFGKIDILVNNAGIGRTLSITDTTMADYDLVMDTNVRSAFAFTKQTVPTMVKQHDGQIIMVSSVTGVVGHADETAYTCSKFALRGLGQALDKELLDKGIRTCVFCPHAGATEFEVGFGRTKEGVAKSGFLTPEDVGQALLSVCTQTKNSRIVELRLASNNVKY